MRELVELLPTLVVGGALKLSVAGKVEGTPVALRTAAGLSRHHWRRHSEQVGRLAAGMGREFQP